MNDNRIDQPNKFSLVSLVVILGTAAIGWTGIIAIATKVAPSIRSLLGI
jgi:hypothetical protein